MADKQSPVGKLLALIDNVKYYWKEPPKGRYMSFKEIVAYAGGGIGAYFLISMGSTLLVSTTNMIVGGAIGIGAMDMYILYVICTIANVPLTAVRANMVDNTRGKAGKYRPYLISMGIPTAVIAVGYVWFPYERLGDIFTGQIFGRDAKYIATCVVVLVFNLFLIFFYNFFMDAYTNLIHVLSPNTQERTDVLSIKSVVYSLAPSILNLVLPLIAQFAANDNLYDIKVYRIAYSVFAVIGMGLTIIVFANTEEKIVQAKTHTIQISFMDSFKAVAKNKYFWIIALAGWLGFLESAYGNILTWSYNYGHTTNGTTFALIQTLTGNAALWGMLLAPFCIKRWGKKRVLIAVNTANVICILLMIVNMQSIWWLFVCVYFNWMVGAFEQITGPAIQADIRDYQQYRTGERIDGMFATVTTIGGLVTLATSAVLPAVQQYYGIVDGNGYESPFDILDVNTGEPGLLYKLMGALIIMAAVGAFLNVVPYLFYNFNEKKQKSVIRVLQVRALFEDYGNNALNNHQIVEAIGLVNNAREMAKAEYKTFSKDEYSKAAADKSSYKNIADKAEKKAAKKAHNEEVKAAKKAFKASRKEALLFNEEIDISKFVCDELDKFDSDLFRHESDVYSYIYARGLNGIIDININAVREELKKAKALPKNTEEKKAFRRFEIKTAKNKLSAKKAYDKYYGTINEFKEPDMAALTALFDKEDAAELRIFELNEELVLAKKADDKSEIKNIKAKIKGIGAQLKKILKDEKVLMDEFAKFIRASKPFDDAKKFLTQQENYSHFDEIAALYDEAKLAAAEEDKLKAEELEKKRAEEKAELEARKAMKKEKRNKNKK